jgi:hypothetical protein
MTPVVVAVAITGSLPRKKNNPPTSTSSTSSTPSSRGSSRRRPGRRRVGRNQGPVMEWALARGADAVRTGLEDNVRVSKDRLARSDAELVQMAAEAIARDGARPATPAEASTLLSLAPA